MVDKARDVCVLACPAPLVHAGAFSQHAEVEAEQLVQIFGGHCVVLTAQAVHEIHAGGAIMFWSKLTI
ncbi:hypothetical protein D3C76_1634600 [compost metagenome]